MGNDIKTEFVKQAQFELQQRIAKTDVICEQLKKGHTGYSSLIILFLLMLAYGLFLSALAWTIINVDVVFSIYPSRNYNRDSMIAKGILLGICIYIILRIYNGIIHIVKIAQINNLILKVKNISKLLSEKIANLDSIANDAGKLVLGNTNEKITAKNSIDADISKYLNIAEKYETLSDNSIGVPLLVLHWMSAVLFAVIFLLISNPFIVGKLCEWLNIYEYGILSSVYMIAFLFVFMILQTVYPFNPGTKEKNPHAKKRKWNPSSYFTDPQTYLAKSNKKNPPSKKHRIKKSLIGVAASLALIVGFGVYDDWFPGIFSGAEKLIESGQKYYHENDYDNAIKQFDDVIRFYPNYAPGYAWRGETLRIEGQYDTAIGTLDEAIRLNQDYAWAYARRGEAYLMEAQYDSAISDFSEAVRLDLNTFDYDYDNAIVQFDEAIRHDPNYALGYAWRGETYRRKAQYDLAIDDLNRAIRLNPEYAWAYAWRGDIYHTRNQYDTAIRDLNDAIKLDQDYAFAYAIRGNSYRMKEQYDAAISDFDEAISLDPNYAWAYLRRGYSYNMEKEYDTAINDMNEAIRLEPNDTRAYAWRGEAHYNNSQYDMAINDLNQAVELDPTYARAYAWRGNSYRMKRQYDTAISDLSQAVKLDPTYAGAYAMRGDSYRMKSQYDTAISDLSQAIKLDPTYAGAYAWRGDSYRMKKQYDTAIRDLNQAIKLNPNYAWAYGSRGWTYKQSGQKNQAIQDFEKALSINPNLEWVKRELQDLK